MDIRYVDGCAHRSLVGPLFQEYTDMLLAEKPAFAKYLQLQRYDEELSHLAEKYGPPGGRLYLLLFGDEAVGTGALRPLEDGLCELKRLYIRPAFRGQGLAEETVRRLIDDARALGYRQMVLDTFPFLKGAIHLYKKLGFREIPSYNGAPMPDLIYLGLDLTKPNAC